MSNQNKKNPWYPHKGVTWGNLFFYAKHKTFSLNPFDKDSIEEAKIIIVKELRAASPDYKTFIKASTMALNLSERTIKRLLYQQKDIQ
jgi:hypothetical protein